MDGQNDTERPRSRVKRRSSISASITIAIVALFLVSFYLYVLKGPATSSVNPAESTAEVSQAPLTGQTTVETPHAVTETAFGQPDRTRLQPGQEAPSLAAEITQENQTQTGFAGQPAAQDVFDQRTPQPPQEADLQRLITEINAFYAHLDQQPYMQDFSLQESSDIYFSKLVQKLVDNPPVVLGETDDLFTLLQNTAHFFRILGKQNINIIKSILDREKNSFEQVVKTFYDLTYHPTSLKNAYALSIPPEALTDYAAFFLNTMGGRLYLFRRDSTLRMMVSYYAVITIDRANMAGNGGHGIDLYPAILSLIEEIENGGNLLQQKDQYLDTLYDLQEKYN